MSIYFALHGDSTTPRLIRREQSSNYKGVSLNIVHREPLTRYEIRTTVENAIDDCKYEIDQDEQRDLMVRVWADMCKINTALTDARGIIKIICKFRIKHCHTPRGITNTNLDV